MRICIIDGNEIETRDMLHDILSKALDFPEWYGRNLDALYDCLTDAGEETDLQFWNQDALESHLGSYAKALVKVVRAAAKENAGIRLEFY
ncbi:MAG: barstar family protein [Lachnospiraceae bacterium]|jgi:ribonuclease inhibitor|nr:barstar family protein [Lachnospiraceae bacterium]